jgi:hypothetical protein
MTAKANLRHDLAINLVLGEVIAAVRVDPISTIPMLLTWLQLVFRGMAIRAERFKMAGKTESPFKSSIFFMILNERARMIEIFRGFQSPGNRFFMTFRAQNSSSFEYFGMGIRDGSLVFCFQISAA